MIPQIENKDQSDYGVMRMVEVPELPSIYMNVVPIGASSKARQSKIVEVDGAKGEVEIGDGCVLSYQLSQDGGIAQITGCTGCPTHLVIPETIDGATIAGIGPYALKSTECLEEITLPSGLLAIDVFAFMDSGVSRINCPSTLREIGTKAFLRCGSLASIELNQGLEHIGEAAFCNSGLTSLHVPASVTHFGFDALLGSKIDFSDGAMPVTFDGNTRYCIDEQGCLYETHDGEKRLFQLINAALEHCEIANDCVSVGRKAFSAHKNLTSVIIPPSVRVVENAAFGKCHKLCEITLCEGIESLGDNALNETAIVKIELPASITHLGTLSLYTHVPGRCNVTPPLKSVAVAEENPVFYMDHGLLCERLDNGMGRAVIYTGTQETITIPDEITVIGSHCFAGTHNARRIVLHDGIVVVDLLGCAFKSGIQEIVVKSLDPNKETHMVRYPTGFSGENAVQMSFWEGTVDLALMTKQADRAITYCQNKFQRASLVCHRLTDPVGLMPGQRALYEGILRREFDSVVREFSSHGYTSGFDKLRELGFLNDENISHAIEIAINCSEAKAVNHLISMRRLSGSAPLLDLDL